MAHAIGITVVALGVENQTDLPLLAARGVGGATVGDPVSLGKMAAR